MSHTLHFHSGSLAVCVLFSCYKCVALASRQDWPKLGAKSQLSRELQARFLVPNLHLSGGFGQLRLGSRRHAHQARSDISSAPGRIGQVVYVMRACQTVVRTRVTHAHLGVMLA